MSRIGKKPIDLPKGVEVTVATDKVVVKGPKGTIECDINKSVNVVKEDNSLSFSLKNTSNETNLQSKADYGTARALVQTAILGVSEGWKKTLELNGVGYNAKVAGKDLVLSVGYSHQVIMEIPQGITCSVDKNTIINLESSDKQVIGNFSAKVRKVCPPEPYLGKGIKYSDEKIRRKAGKTGGK